MIVHYNLAKFTVKH